MNKHALSNASRQTLRNLPVAFVLVAILVAYARLKNAYWALFLSFAEAASSLGRFVGVYFTPSNASLQAMFD